VISWIEKGASMEAPISKSTGDLMKALCMLFNCRRMARRHPCQPVG
jgi:hypothetical protein